jgi:hypothetical protein
MSGLIKLLMALTAVASAVSCGGAGAMFDGGEAFGIGAANYGTSSVENGRVDGVGADRRSYDNQSLKRPYLGQRPSFSAASILQDNKQRIPDSVSVSWLDLPEQGNPSFSGKINGPFVVDIRSKIPGEILQYAQRRFFSIRISLTINSGPISMNWALHRVQENASSPSYLCVGGDHFLRTGETSFNPMSASAGAKPVSVWPNCKLP